MFFRSEHSTDDHSSSLPYDLALLLVGISLVIYLIKLAESQNRLQYDNRLTRVISGSLRMLANNWHTTRDDIEFTDTAGKILAIGPHKTGIVDASVVVSKMKGTPPCFFVTDAFNQIPGVSSFIKLSKGIPIKSDKKSSNAGALEQAGRVLDENGCIAIFPQGNFAKIGQVPPRIYEGTARLALEHKVPVHVIRLDGFWSLQNFLLPVFIRNSVYYRAFFSALHMNNIRVTQCDVIDFHLKNEGNISNDKEIIDEICAQLYAYFRHANDLTPKQIKVIKNEITNKMHLTIWNSKLKQGMLEKELAIARQEEAKLSEPTSIAMKNT